MLYDETFLIMTSERIPDGMGGYEISEPREVGRFKATTIPLSMEFSLTESAYNITEIRRLITDAKLPIDFQTTKEQFTLRELRTEQDYTLEQVFPLGKETSLLIRRDNS